MVVSLASGRVLRTRNSVTVMASRVRTIRNRYVKRSRARKLVNMRLNPVSTELTATRHCSHYQIVKFVLPISGSLRVQLVADAPHRLNSYAGTFEFIAHVGHVNVNGTGLSVEVESPHEIKQLLAAQDDSLVLGKHH